jgi:PAS domain S-box-containing protein
MRMGAMEQSSRLAESLSDDGRYRLLIEAVTDYAIYMLDPTGLVTSWNPGAQRFKGYTPSEIIGQHFSRFYTPEDQKRGIPALALATAVNEGKFESEGWRVRKDGSRFWAFVVIDPIRTPTGEVIGFAKITRDLTQRKAAEDALKQSQEQFRLLVQGVSDYAIYMLDTTGVVTNWNLGAQRIKGYSPEEIIGNHFSKFYTDEDRQTGEPQKALQTAEQEGRFEKEGWRVRKDGTRFWAHVIIDAIRDDHGKLIGYAKITRDITERKNTQQQLEAAREALHQSQKMEAIGQLTGGVAHDFNNLLMAVLGSLELMRKRLPDDAKLKALLENAVQGAQRGSVLTKRMLAFARRQELKKEAVDIPELVRGMTDLLQRSLGPSILIETHFPLVSKAVLADANQLEMILLNLTVNARDAMPDGGRVVIATREEVLRAGDGSRLKPGAYICLTVSDTGMGMDEMTLRRAMEPFFTTKGLGKGTGLGLSMVHGVAEQSGGWFTLRSREGKGTTAELWLPVAEGQADALGRSEPSASDAVAKQRSLVVLAVDDDRLVLTNTVAMLDDLGHTGMSASSGKEALNILRQQNSVDLVITDYAMPQMNGLQLADAIKKEWPELPVIIATGFAEMEPETKSSLPKLAKPFTEAELAKELEHIVPRARIGGRVLKFQTGAGSKN